MLGPLGAAWDFAAGVPWSHVIDIGIMWFLLYQVYIRFRGTLAMRLLVRVFGVWLAYLAAQALGLTLTSFLLWALWLAFLILFLVTFQGEIQRIFVQLNPLRRMSALLRRLLNVRLPEESLGALSESAFALAGKGIGAILIIERSAPVEGILSSPGEVIDAAVRPALIETLFHHGAPYHDGAACIRAGRVHRAGCVLPLSENPDLPAEYGTRHRAAIGVTEQSDALALVVSEERGEVTAVEGGRARTVDTPAELTQWMTERLRAPREESSRAGLLRDFFAENWRPKLAALAAVCALWLVGVAQRDNPRNFFARLGAEAEEEFTVPVAYYNLPGGLVLGDGRIERVSVRLSGRRDSLNFLDAGRLRMSVNLRSARPGAFTRVLTGKNIDLPAGVRLVEVSPAEIEVRLRPRRAPPPGAPK